MRGAEEQEGDSICNPPPNSVLETDQGTNTTSGVKRDGWNGYAHNNVLSPCSSGNHLATTFCTSSAFPLDCTETSNFLVAVGNICCSSRIVQVGHPNEVLKGFEKLSSASSFAGDLPLDSRKSRHYRGRVKKKGRDLHHVPRHDPHNDSNERSNTRMTHAVAI